MNRRLTVTGLALLTALGLGACQTDKQGSTGGPATPAAAATGAAPDPAALKALQAAAAKLAQDTVKIRSEMGGGVTMTGALDPKTGRGDMRMRMAAPGDAEGSDIRIVKDDGDTYLKFSGGLANVVGTKWMRVPAEKLKAGSAFQVMPEGDPTGAGTLARAVTQVRRDGANGFAGLLDVTRSPTLNKDSLKALGARSGTVPFTATVDGEGRLTGMTVDMSGLAPTAGTLRTTYSDFGAPVKVKVPSAWQVTDPPAALSGLLNA